MSRQPLAVKVGERRALTVEHGAKNLFEHRGRLRWALLAAGSASLIVGVFLLAPADATASGTTPKQLLHAASADASARTAVHVSEVGHTKAGPSTESADVGLREGRQAFDLPRGGRAHVLVVDDMAYLSGNRTALIHYFRFSSAIATKIGASWVSIPPSNPDYAVMARDVTLGSFLFDLTPRGRLTMTASTDVGGVRSFGIRGTNPASASPRLTSMTVYVSRSASPLPLGATTSDDKGDTASAKLSRWGERLTLKAPSDAIPISKLGQ